MFCVRETVGNQGYFYALPTSLAVAPREEAVVEAGDGAKVTFA